MNGRRPGLLRRLLTLLLVLVVITAVVRVAMIVILTGTRTPVPARVGDISHTFLYPGADAVRVTYEAEDGRTYTSTVMAEPGTLQAGDELPVYASRMYPFIATTMEDHGIRMRTILIALLVLAVMNVLARLIGAKIGKRVENMQKPYSDFYTEQDDGELLDRFWESFQDSLRYKVDARLHSALEEREEGLEMVKDHPEYSGMAYHNLLILRCFHCCQGVQAYEDGVNSLKHKEEFLRFSDQMRPKLGYSSYDESLVYTAMLARNREEAKALLQEAAERKADATAVKHAKEMLGMIDHFPRWVDYQKNYAANLASRHSANMDRGDYAPASALLEVILSREGQKGYDLTEEEYVSLLDDYLMFSLKYFLLRTQVLIKGYPFPETELFFLLKKPLQLLIDFLPDCGEERFREIFRGVMKQYACADEQFRADLPEYEQALALLGM